MEQAAEAVDALAPQGLALEQCRVLQREDQQVRDAVGERLVCGGEDVGPVGCQPQRAVHDRFLPHGADDPRLGIDVIRIGHLARHTDALRGDLEAAGRASRVQHERLRAIEAQDVQRVERDLVAENPGETRHDVAEAPGFGDQARHRREDGRRTAGLFHRRLYTHESDPPV